MAWFGRRRNTPTPIIEPVTPSLPFHELLANSCDELTWSIKANSHILSAEVYSEFRVIDDVYRDVIEFITNLQLRKEQQYILENTIQNYIPSTLAIFRQLPVSEQTPGGEADVLLLTQCKAVEKNIRDLKKDLQAEVMRNLAIQTAFMEERLETQV